jgi:type II secretory pathway pseudopilin PulG
VAAKVETQNEVYLNGVYYPLTRPVQSVLSSLYPAKVVIGDTSKDSQARTSVIAWSDWRGGIGVNRMEHGGDVNRAWWSTLQLRYKNHLILPGLDNDAAANASSTSLAGPTIGAIGELSSEIYVAWNGSVSEAAKIYKYNNTSDAWGSALATPADRVTDTVTWRALSDVTFLVFAHYDANGSGYTYYSKFETALDGAITSTSATSVPVDDASGFVAGQIIVVDSEDMSIDSISSNTLTVTRGANSTTAATHLNGATVSTGWTSDAQDTQYVAAWDDRLWGISYAGQLWYSIVAGTEVNDAKLPLPAGSVTALFVARDAGGEPILYAATKKGLFAHDAANAKFVQTELTLPNHPFAGKGTIRWRDSIYMPAGLGVYRYINQAGGAVLTITGPDRDDGLPTDNRGTIKYMSGSHNELFVGVDSATRTPLESQNSVPHQWKSHHGSPVIDASGFSSILGYNGLGWETKWVAVTNSEGKSVQHMLVSDAYSEYRLWWGFAGEIKFMKIPSDIINPSFVSDFEFKASGTHETPWFNAGQSEVDKLALKLKIEVQDVSTTETVKITYATDYNEQSYSYFTNADGDDVSTITSTTLGATSGITTFTFGSSAGTPFRAIKFKLELDRTTDTDTDNYKKKTPDVVSLTLEWRKKLEAKWGHQVQIDMNKEYKGKSPKDLRSSLLSAIESTTLVEFTFRDDSGGTRNFYVDVASATGMEYSGYDERGATTINLVEP